MDTEYKRHLQVCVQLMAEVLRPSRCDAALAASMSQEWR